MNIDQATWEKWKNWLEIADDNFTQILIRRQMWDRFHQMLDEAPDHGALKQYGGPFVTWVAGMYVDSQAIAVRRQYDNQSDVISLRRLLEDMKNNHNVVDQLSKNPATVSELEQEITRLTTVSQQVRKFVNKQVAHLDHKSKVHQATFRELNESINQLGVLMQRCYSILLNSNMQVEVVEATGWEEIFKYPRVGDTE